LKVISREIENAGLAIQADTNCEIPTLFIRGERSDYIQESDFNIIREIFTRSYIETIPNAGHWIHAEQPAAFLKCILHFVK
jgi:pimeloyl-ACP methyl ester carboxylesterase